MIVPLFLMNRGCPHRCIFCDARQIAGRQEDPLSENDIRRTLALYTQKGKGKSEPVELAFFGGNFTGMERSEQIRLLEISRRLIRRGEIRQVRISTRPDDLDTERLAMLAEYGVGVIEIGAQSLADDVLDLAGRGHRAEDVRRATLLAREGGFRVGLHLMAGLPGDNEDKFADTIARTIALQPHMVRLHPTLVFAGTPLAARYRDGRYQPLTLPEAIALCKKALVAFDKAGIPVIRMGLQETEWMQKPGSIVAGPHHPAFRALVESSLFLDMAGQLLMRYRTEGDQADFAVSPRDVSSFRGQRSGNIHALIKKFRLASISVRPDPGLERGSLVLARQGAGVAQLDRSDLY